MRRSLTALLLALSLSGHATAADLYESTLRGTAWVVTPSKGKGTAWLLDRDRRLLVTNFHVVADHETVDVVFPAYRDRRLVTERRHYAENLKALAVPGRVVRRDAARDLALVEVESVPEGAVALKLAVERLGPGEAVHSVGNRGDLDVLWTSTAGHVRQAYRTEEGYFWNGRHLAKGASVLLTQSPINEGDSGGPVVNARGEVVGVASAVRWQGRLASLCIDAAEVRAFAGDGEAKDAPGAGTEVYRKTLRSVAMVRTASSNSRGTAWVLDAHRKLLVTTARVAADRDFVDVFFPEVRDGKVVVEPGYYRDNARALRHRGRVLARDAGRNLALIEVDALPEGIAELTLAAESARPGQSMHAVGNPNSVEALWVYAAGSVRQIGRTRLGDAKDGPEVVALVAQLPLSDGDGGGPIVDDGGRLVGVASGKDAPQQLVSYALDVGEVRAFVAATKATWSPATADEFARRAALFARLRVWDRATADCTVALRLNPKDAAALAGRGRARLMRGDAAGAVIDCDAALALDPRLVTAYCHRAAAFAHKGEHDRALADAAEALRLDPKSAAAFTARGSAYRLKGDLDRAVADTTEAIWLDANLAAAYYHRGLAHLARREPEKAASDLARAAYLDPNWADACRAWGDALRQRGEEAKAVAAYGKALEADPDDALALYRRGLAYQATREPQKALADHDEAVRLRPSLAADVLAAIESMGAAAKVRPAIDAAKRESDEARRGAAVRAILAELRGR
jgi:tetratricopeptide (TPR) repeat protein